MRERRNGGRGPRRRVALATALAAGSFVALAAPAPTQAATSVAASWEMNESGGTVMRDAGPHGIDGVIGGKIDTNGSYYSWPYKRPNAPPAERDRLAIVEDDDRIDPGDEDYAIEFRYRTTQNFGNVVQKGQNASPGGYWKFEQPNGRMICLFKDRNGLQKAVRSPIETNDGRWHTIRCELSDWGIRLFVDGRQVRTRQVAMAPIDNSRPLSIGGKENCNQRNVTCDYFTGQIDYVRIEKGGSTAPPPPPPPENEAPTASFTVACDGTSCAFDSAGSEDPDGQIVNRAWTFGDGSTATGTAPQHVYAVDGQYTVTLTVTDDGGATGRAEQTVSVGDPPTPTGELAFVAGRSESRWSTAPGVTIPSVEAGDTLLLFATAASPVTVGDPSGSGWQAVDGATGPKIATRMWTKAATTGDSGATINVPLSSGAKANVTVVAYRGGFTSDPISAADVVAGTTYTSERTTPVVPVADDGSWVISFWVHRDSSSTSLVPPPGVAVRAASTMSGGGHPTVLMADSGAGVPAVPAGGLTATASAASNNGITATVVLRPG